eukprot:4290964-Alexandrium_andersonii.AAC.1
MLCGAAYCCMLVGVCARPSFRHTSQGAAIRHPSEHRQRRRQTLSFARAWTGGCRAEARAEDVRGPGADDHLWLRQVHAPARPRG